VKQDWIGISMTYWLSLRNPRDRKLRKIADGSGTLCVALGYASVTRIIFVQRRYAHRIAN
jgi:hypothetical protein